MQMKRFEINVHDYGLSFEESMNDKLKSATHVQTVVAPYNSGRTIVIYAFYPDKEDQDK